MHIIYDADQASQARDVERVKTYWRKYKEDGNTASLWMALRDVVEAQGDIGKLAQRTKADPQHLNDIFDSK